MTDEDRLFIEDAARHFYAPGFLMRAANLLGQPIEFLMKHALPERAGALIASATRTAMEKTLLLALKTVDRTTRPPRTFSAIVAGTLATKRSHVLLSSLSGAAGGFFGLEALPLELPITTGILLREIAAIAAEFGEDLMTIEGQLECLNIFALASVREAEKTKGKDGDYFSVRFGLANLIRQAALTAKERGVRGLADQMAKGQAAALVRFMTVVAERFEIAVSEKALAQLVPIVSAVSGAGVNALFAEHLGQTARYHFGLRALERRLGEDDVRSAYQIAALALAER